MSRTGADSPPLARPEQDTDSCCIRACEQEEGEGRHEIKEMHENVVGAACGVDDAQHVYVEVGELR